MVFCNLYRVELTIAIRRFGDVDLDMAEFSRNNRPNKDDHLWDVFVDEFLSAREDGYEDTTILQEAETEDLQESFEECKVKKPHRRLILKAFEGLKKSSAACTIGAFRAC